MCAVTHLRPLLVVAVVLARLLRPRQVLCRPCCSWRVPRLPGTRMSSPQGRRPLQVLLRRRWTRGSGRGLEPVMQHPATRLPAILRAHRQLMVRLPVVPIWTSQKRILCSLWVLGVWVWVVAPWRCRSLRGRPRPSFRHLRLPRGGLGCSVKLRLARGFGVRLFQATGRGALRVHGIRMVASVRCPLLPALRRVWRGLGVLCLRRQVVGRRVRLLRALGRRPRLLRLAGPPWASLLGFHFALPRPRHPWSRWPQVRRRSQL